MLKALHKRGFEVWALNSFVFKAPSGAKRAFGDLKSLFSHDPNKVFVFDEDHIHYIYTRAMSTEESEMTLAESQLFYSTWIQILEEYEPDLVIGSGDTPLIDLCFAEAKRRLISTHYMVSSRDSVASLFPNVDLLTADSKAMADRYYERSELNVVPIGDFFELKDIIAPVRQKRYITFINPTPHKGLSIFAKIAKAAQIRMPHLEFLVVNSQQNFNEELLKLHTKDKSSEHPYKLSDFPNVFLVNGQDDIRKIYSITSVLLVPSLWFEPWGRVATEATLNGIPVVASNMGGLVQSTGGGGCLIDLPSHVIEDFYSLPNDDEIEPWLKAIEKAMEADFWSTLEAAKKQLSVVATVDNLVSLISPLILKTQYLRTFARLNAEALDTLSKANTLDKAANPSNTDQAKEDGTNIISSDLNNLSLNLDDASLAAALNGKLDGLDGKLGGLDGKLDGLDSDALEMLDELGLSDNANQKRQQKRAPTYFNYGQLVYSLSSEDLVSHYKRAQENLVNTNQKVIEEFSTIEDNNSEPLPKKTRTKAAVLNAFKENQRGKAQSTINQILLRHETLSRNLNNTLDAELCDITFQ